MRVEIGLKAALHYQIHGAVKIHAGLVEMAGLVLLLAFVKAGLDLSN